MNPKDKTEFMRLATFRAEMVRLKEEWRREAELATSWTKRFRSFYATELDKAIRRADALVEKIEWKEVE